MGWQDDFGYLNNALQSGYVGSTPRPTDQRPFRPRAGLHNDARDVSRSSSLGAAQSS